MDREERLAMLRAKSLELSARLEQVSDSELDRLEQILHMAEPAVRPESRAWLTGAHPEFWSRLGLELRTPLAAILGFADLLQTSAPSESERREYAATIRRNGQQLAKLLDTLEMLSRLETGCVELELDEVPVGELLQEVEGLLRARAVEKGIELSIEYSSLVPARVRTGGQHLRRLLTSLVDNAIKFTDSGSVRLLVSFSREAIPPTLTFRVMDSGRGMDHALASAILRPFQHSAAQPGKPYAAAGLGLAVARALTALLGGELGVFSRVGTGTAFTLHVPVAVDGGVAMVDRPPSVTATVLLALPVGKDRSSLELLLRRAGHDVSVVDNGRVAVDRVTCAFRANRTFDVIVVGTELPELNGCDAATRLRGEGYQGVLLALSARPLDAERERCIAAGCDAYLSIESAAAALLEMVRDMLETPPATLSMPAPRSC